jgi:pimeloyl-ACP methyl ester carboxylesterase
VESRISVTLPVAVTFAAAFFALTQLPEARAAGTLRLGPFRELRPGPHGGSIWRGVIPGAVRKSAIYLPPGFSTDRRYPVVYLLHGMPGSPWSYVNSLSLAALSDTLISRHEVRPFIAVVPVAGPSGHYDGEWTGPWERYLVHDVVPWVDEHLPTIREARGRILAGLSAGGYGAVDVGLRNPGMFGRLESWGGYFEPFRDGTLTYADRAVLARNDPRLVVRREATLLRRLAMRFYLSSGPGHGKVQPRDTVRFAHELGELDLSHRLSLLRNGRHQWERQLSAGLRWAVAAKD